MRCVSMMRWENCHAFIRKEEERKMRFSTPIISLCVAATCIIMLVVQHRRKRDLTSSSSPLFFPGISVCFAKISIDGLKVRSVTN